jgi:hypothetical protein
VTQFTSDPPTRVIVSRTEFKRCQGRQYFRKANRTDAAKLITGDTIYIDGGYHIMG